MTVTVTIFSPSDGGGKASGIGKIRIQERVAVGASTVNPTKAGEMVVIGNGETSMIAAAYGTTPDAATVTSNDPVTSAGIPIGAGSVSLPIVPTPGSLFNVKTIP